MPEPPRIAHIVSHTHWDREWYRTFEIFRMRLVALTDSLLDLLDRDPDYRYYYWDGQTVVIDDYLEIRPENADRLRRHFASGRLAAGPWFIQPDEFLVSGEAMVRNLLLGRRMCDAWGTGAAIGYAPDAFGHISQMPQILRGFGIDNAVLFRGITTDQVDAEFHWASPDGSEVLCIKMSDDSAYSNYFYHFRETLADTDRDRPLDPAQVEREAESLLAASLQERPTTRNLLWMDGVDHVFPQPRTPEILRLVNAGLGDRVRAEHSTLPAFVAAVRAAAPELKTVTGELRVSNRAWRLQALLTHVASSRIHLKQLNHRCETLLERYAEPWCALAWLHGRDYPEAFLRHAWRLLLLNQPHDSICGCSIDRVHRDMLPRFDQCLQVGEALTADALSWLAERTDSSTAVPDARAALVVFNSLGWDREQEVVEALVELPSADAPETLAVYGPDGNAVPCSAARLPDRHRLSQTPHDIPVAAHLRRWKLRFLASAPAFGHADYTLAPGPAPALAETVAAGDNWLQNEHLRVEVAPNGTIQLTDRGTGQVYRNGLLFEDGGDIGDGYNYIKPPNDVVITTQDEETPVEWRIIGSPEPAARRLTYARVWNVAAQRVDDLHPPGSVEEVHIEVTLSLSPGARRLEVSIAVANYARDHRLRVLFPTGLVGATHSAAEQAYDIVQRPVTRPDGEGWREPPPATAPQKSFVDVSDGEHGLCLLNRGIPEYELMGDENRTLALTLLRCTANGVGAPEELEEGQMYGTHRFEIALYPHRGDAETARVWREAHNFNVPMGAAQTGIHTGPLPAVHRHLATGPEEMVPTAIKRAEDGAALVVRAANYGAAPVAARFALPGARSAQSARLDETPIETLPLDADGGVSTDTPARRVVTVRFEP